MTAATPWTQVMRTSTDRPDPGSNGPPAGRTPACCPVTHRQSGPFVASQRERRTGAGVILCLALLVLGSCSAAAPGDSTAVSVEVAGQTLGTAVPRIGKAAGVRLAVDRTLADQRILLFTRKQPLATVRKQLQEFVPTPPGKAVWS